MPASKVTSVLRVVTGAAALFVIAKASAFAVPFHSDSQARLRLSWSAVPERIETCRVLSDEELAKVEVHMRQRVKCEGQAATYLLKVEVDGEALHEQVVRGGGLRHDRPLHLLREVDVPAGDHHVVITFARREKAAENTDSTLASDGIAQVAAEADTGRFAGRAERELQERKRRDQGAIPELLLLDSQMHFAPREVKVVTFNRDQRTLKVLTAESPVN